MFRKLLLVALALLIPQPLLAGEIGPDDFRVSHAGGDEVFDASWPHMAHNPDDGEYLTVWYGNDDSIEGMSADHFEIWGQRLWPDLSPRGDRFRVSTTGNDASPEYRVGQPRVGYNPDAGEYLVVWHGPLTNGEIEILGQRIEGGSGTFLGGNIRLTQHGPEGNPLREAYAPDLAYGNQQGEWMLVYSGDVTTVPLFDDEFDIFAQRLDALGVAVTPAVRISQTGPLHSYETDASDPCVVYNPTMDEFFVSWSADLTSADDEIYGQRVEATTGTEVGPDDFWISDGSTDGHDLRPSVVYNGPGEEYLVLWTSNSDATLGYEIYAQRLIAFSGAAIGTNDFRVTMAGPLGDPAISSILGFSAAFSPAQQRYMVTWSGQESAETGYEIYAQLLSATGAEIGPPEIRVSTTGPEGENLFLARSPTVAEHNSAFAIVWAADSDEGERIRSEYEIEGQLLSGITGSKINDARQVSLMGTKDDYAAYASELCYNPLANEYLVAWLADGEKYGLEYGHFGVFVRRFDADTGEAIDAADLRIDSSPIAFDRPAVAFNPVANEYMVVWSSDYSPSGLVGQRLDADTLAEVGTDDFEIVQPAPSANSGAGQPAIAYCSSSNLYVVVWSDDRGSSGFTGTELYLHRLDPNGTRLDPSPMLLSLFFETGYFYASDPQIAYDPTSDEALIVWTGTGATFNSSSILRDRVVVSTGSRIGASQHVSNQDADPAFYHLSPAVAFNSMQREFLVVWHSNVQFGSIDHQIHGQLLDAQGSEIGANDFPVTATFTRANQPDVAYSPVDQEYLVTWEAHIAGVGKQIYGQFLDRWAGASTGSIPLSQAPFSGLSEMGVTRSRVAHATGPRNYMTIWDGNPSSPSPFETIGREIRGQLVESDTATAAPLPLTGPAFPRLTPIYPNPFSGRAQLFLELDRREDVTVEVFDARGRRVATLFEGPMSEAAPHALTLQGRDLANGVYWVRAKVGDWVGTQKAAVLR